jgi:hypothetical protein
MASEFSFTFRNTTYPATASFSFDNLPYFVFITISDRELIKEFSPEISIKTDGDEFIHSSLEKGALTDLKKDIFDSVKLSPSFLEMKKKYKSRMKKVKYN